MDEKHQSHLSNMDSRQISSVWGDNLDDDFVNSSNNVSDYQLSLNHLVLNFYPDGYSLAVKLNEFPVFTSETILETAKISYEEKSLLDYIENEELPPLLVDMIDSSPKLNQYKIWHNGCLILEVRDRINTPAGGTKNEKIENFYISLKPTNLSMMYDVINLTGSKCWTAQERLHLESQIVLHNSPPLYLDSDATKLPPKTRHTTSNYQIASSIDRVDLQARLKNIYSKRHVSSNGNGNKNSVNGRQSPDVVRPPPPELTLQQFLATRKSKKRLPIPVPKFQRFKKHNNNK